MACKFHAMFLCAKSKSLNVQQPTDNITGGEKNANIQPVSEKGKTDRS
jgi:hypothetical protein